MLQLSFVTFKKDSYILVAGKLNVNKFYIIQVGTVRCFRQDNAKNPDTLGPGDFLGVISCMSGKPQIENAIATSDVVCIAVQRDQYTELIQRNTPVAMKIIRTFAARMRVMNNQLTSLNTSSTGSSNSSNTTGNEQMFNVGLYYDKRQQYKLAYFCYYQFLRTGPVGTSAEIAKARFMKLRATVKVPYLVPTADLVREYPKDTMIMCEAQSGNEMFIIQEGNVKISKIINGEEVTLALLKRGDMFGEMALLENKPRSATAIAHDDCKLMTINRQNFNQMVTTQAQLISKLTTMLAERLWSMSRQLSNAKLVDPLVKIIDMISLQIEKSKTPIAKGIVFNTELSAQELANMCGISDMQLPDVIRSLMRFKYIRIAAGERIMVLDTQEAVKDATIRRKQYLVAKQ